MGLTSVAASLPGNGHPDIQQHNTLDQPMRSNLLPCWDSSNKPITHHDEQTNMNSTELQYLLGMAGTVAFAATAVCVVTPRGIDLFGACVMGLITAIGGGTIRDLILDVPVFYCHLAHREPGIRAKVNPSSF